MSVHEESFQETCELITEQLEQINWDAELFTLHNQLISNSNARNISPEEFKRLHEILNTSFKPLPENLTEARKVDLVVQIFERNFSRFTDIEAIKASYKDLNKFSTTPL